MKYAFNDEKAAKAYGRSLPISMKKSIEICNFIRGKSLARARMMLQRVTEMKQAVPYRRFQKGGTGHKKGIGPGRYPVKTAEAFLKLLRSAEANAQQKGMSPERLYIDSIAAQKAATNWHYGRKRRRKMKAAHIQIAVREMENKRKK